MRTPDKGGKEQTDIVVLYESLRSKCDPKFRNGEDYHEIRWTQSLVLEFDLLSLRFSILTTLVK